MDQYRLTSNYTVKQMAKMINLADTIVVNLLVNTKLNTETKVQVLY